MKLEILRENLSRAVSVVAKVSNKNLSLPVLGCVVIAVESGRVLLKATNLDVSTEVVLKAKVLKPGIAAIPAHILSATVATLTDQRLTIELISNSVVIKGERGTTSITAVDATEFPTLPFVREGVGVSTSLPARDFVALIRSVSFAASTLSIKPELSAVSLSFDGKYCTAVATDSFRLAEVKVPVTTKSNIQSVLLPARNMADIIRAVESDETLEVRIGENQCSFLSSFGHITSRTIDGAFPDYHAIIPKNFVASATCLKEDAANVFKKVSIFTDSFNQVRLSLQPSEKNFSVSAVNANVGETIDYIPAALDGEDIDINFNARYIIDALPVVSGDSITFSIAGHGRPMVITDTPHKHFTYLVMPMNR